MVPRNAIDARWRQGLISGTWSVDGKVMPGFDGALTLALADSTLAGKPLAADVRTRVVLGDNWSPLRIDKTAVGPPLRRQSRPCQRRARQCRRPDDDRRVGPRTRTASTRALRGRLTLDR